jgi:LmbE family N-acetylglucosaminyl deacetylase
VCTDGSKGSWDPDEDLARLVVTRRAEQQAASRALGGSGEVVFLGWPDGELESGVRQRAQVAAAIRRFRPDVVLGHDPWKRYRLHPDHRHAGFLAVDGVVAARDPLFFPELQLAPHRPSAMLLWEADEADHVEEVTLAHARAKIDALLAHRSQLLSTMKIDGDDTAARDAFEQGVIDRLTEAGALAGVARAEAFKVIADL